MPTREAYGVAALTLLLFFVAYNLQAGWVYAVDALLAGTLVVGYVSARLAVRGLAVRRGMAAEVVEGESVRVGITAQAGGRLKRRFFLEIRDAVPGLEASTVFISALSREGEASASYVTTAVRRGIHRVESSVVYSRGLTGFFVARRALAAPGEVTVYPRYWPLARFPLVGWSQTPEASASIRRAGGLEFYGLREYRHGDSLRHVHWRSSARRGTLVVREFEQEIPGGIALVLDTRPHVQVGTGAQNTFEDLIRAAASIAWFVMTHGGTMRILAARGASPWEVTGGWGPMLYALAGIEADGTMSPADVYAATRGRESSFVVLTPDADAVADLAGQQLPLAAVVADRASYAIGAEGDGAILMLGALGIPVCVLRKGDDIGARLEGYEGDG